MEHQFRSLDWSLGNLQTRWQDGKAAHLPWKKHYQRWPKMFGYLVRVLNSGQVGQGATPCLPPLICPHAMLTNLKKYDMCLCDDIHCMDAWNRFTACLSRQPNATPDSAPIHCDAHPHPLLFFFLKALTLAQKAECGTSSFPQRDPMRRDWGEQEGSTSMWLHMTQGEAHPESIAPLPPVLDAPPTSASCVDAPSHLRTVNKSVKHDPEQSHKTTLFESPHTIRRLSISKWLGREPSEILQRVSSKTVDLSQGRYLSAISDLEVACWRGGPLRTISRHWLVNTALAC